MCGLRDGQGQGQGQGEGGGERLPLTLLNR